MNIKLFKGFFEKGKKNNNNLGVILSATLWSNSFEDVFLKVKKWPLIYYYYFMFKLKEACILAPWWVKKWVFFYNFVLTTHKTYGHYCMNGSIK